MMMAIMTLLVCSLMTIFPLIFPLRGMCDVVTGGIGWSVIQIIFLIDSIRDLCWYMNNLRPGMTHNLHMSFHHPIVLENFAIDFACLLTLTLP